MIDRDEYLYAKLDEMTEQQKLEWTHYGIVPGPVYKRREDESVRYVASYEWFNEINYRFEAVDLYVAESLQKVLYICQTSDDRDHVGTLYQLLSLHSSPWKEAGYILDIKGKIGWEERKCEDERLEARYSIQ